MRLRVTGDELRGHRIERTVLLAQTCLRNPLPATRN